MTRSNNNREFPPLLIEGQMRHTAGRTQRLSIPVDRELMQRVGAACSGSQPAQIHALLSLGLDVLDRIECVRGSAEDLDAALAAVRDQAGLTNNGGGK